MCKLCRYAFTRFGIGAKGRIKATIRDRPTWQLRLINAGANIVGGQSFTAHFGLGDAMKIDLVRIEVLLCHGRGPAGLKGMLFRHHPG